MAMRLLNDRKKILVFDSLEANTSSRIAAGIFNPISGKRFSTAWKASECFSEVTKFYTEMENLLEERFFHPLPICRIIPDAGSSNDWISRANEPHNSLFVNQVLDDLDNFDTPYGAIELALGGYLDTNAFIDAIRKLLLPHELLVELTAIPKFQGAWTEIDGNRSQAVIYCNGLGAQFTDPFNTIPFTPMKGEVLRIKAPDLSRDQIVTGGCFICPSDNDSFLVGATYNWRDPSLSKTSEAKTELLKRLDKIIKVPYTVIGHQVGIRPSVKDRKPIIGSHPIFPDCHILGGLGSKGVSTAPYLSKLLYEYLENGGDIPSEVDLKRFLG